MGAARHYAQQRRTSAEATEGASGKAAEALAEVAAQAAAGHGFETPSEAPTQATSVVQEQEEPPSVEPASTQENTDQPEDEPSLVTDPSGVNEKPIEAPKEPVVETAEPAEWERSRHPAAAPSEAAPEPVEQPSPMTLQDPTAAIELNEPGIRRWSKASSDIAASELEDAVAAIDKTVIASAEDDIDEAAEILELEGPTNLGTQTTLAP